MEELLRLISVLFSSSLPTTVYSFKKSLTRILNYSTYTLTHLCPEFCRRLRSLSLDLVLAVYVHGYYVDLDAMTTLRRIAQATGEFLCTCTDTVQFFINYHQLSGILGSYFYLILLLIYLDGAISAPPTVWYVCACRACVNSRR